MKTYFWNDAIDVLPGKVDNLERGYGILTAELDTMLAEVERMAKLVEDRITLRGRNHSADPDLYTGEERRMFVVLDLYYAAHKVRLRNAARAIREARDAVATPVTTFPAGERARKLTVVGSGEKV